MKKVQGDLLALALAGHFDVIIHGCNCQCRMKRGIALSISEQFPEAVAADAATRPGDSSKLGSYTQARIERGSTEFTIVNAYTQDHWSGEGPLVDYTALRQVFQTIKLEFHGQKIGYPRIGAGLALGDWATIAAIIDAELTGEDHTLVELHEPVANLS